jgi:hypothetical protein
MKYRDFLEKVRLRQLREGVDGLRIVGEGLAVPHPKPKTSEQWERSFYARHSRVYSSTEAAHEGVRHDPEEGQWTTS